MTDASKSEKADIANDDAPQPGDAIYTQVDDEKVVVRVQSFADNGLCVCVIHDGQFALVMSTQQARLFGLGMQAAADRCDAARAILEKT